jgi:hypothetical protein
LLIGGGGLKGTRLRYIEVDFSGVGALPRRWPSGSNETLKRASGHLAGVVLSGLPRSQELNAYRVISNNPPCLTEADSDIADRACFPNNGMQHL